MSTITIPTPFADGDLLYITSGYVGDQFRPVYAIRPGALGDISLTDEQTSNEFIAWHLTQGGPYNPSPILYGGYYYTLYDRGLFTAHDAKTGTEIYGRQRIAVGEAFTASPWAYNGMIFALSEEGTTYAIEAGAEFKVVGENPLDEFSMATPAIVGSSLVIRTARHLYRIGPFWTRLPEAELLVGRHPIPRRIDRNALKVRRPLAGLRQGVVKKLPRDALPLKALAHKEQRHVIVLPNFDHTGQPVDRVGNDDEVVAANARADHLWLYVFVEFLDAQR